jgi:hypothetical protein
MQLQVLDVPHNLLICDMGARVILWPQCFAAKQAKGEVPQDVLDMGVNPAAFEIAGHMVLKRRKDYDTLTQEKAWEILRWVSLTTQEIDDLQCKLFAAFIWQGYVGLLCCGVISLAVGSAVAEDVLRAAALLNNAHRILMISC